MPVAENLTLRINGQQYNRVTLRFKLEDGYPGGSREIVIPDDFLGPFTLTDEFVIELKEGEDDWRIVTLPYLIHMLDTHRN